MRLVTLCVSEGAWKKSLILGQQCTIIFTITHWWDSGRHRTYNFDYTLPVCVVVTWRRIIRISGVFLREPVLIKFSMFSPNRGPPLLPPADFSSFFFFFTQQHPLFLQQLSSHVGRRGEKPVSGCLNAGEVLLWRLLSVCPSHSISHSHPSLPPFPLFSTSSASSPLPWAGVLGMAVWAWRRLIRHKSSAIICSNPIFFFQRLSLPTWVT